MALAGGLAFSACDASPPPIAGAADEPTVFVNVTVLPMTDGEPRLLGRSVVVEGGRITAIGRTGAVAIPAGATLVAGGGRTLVPALADLCAGAVDAHDGRVFVSQGVTTVRVSGADLSHVALKGRIAAGLTLGPQLHLAPRVNAEGGGEAAGAAVETLAQLGFGRAVFADPLSVAGFRAGVMSAREAQMSVAAGDTGRIPVETSLSLGVSLIEGGRGYGRAAARPRPQLLANMADDSVAAQDNGEDAEPVSAAQADARAWAAARPEALRRLAGYAVHYDAWTCLGLTAVLDGPARARNVRAFYDRAPGAVAGAERRRSWRAQTQDWTAAFSDDVEAGADNRYAFARALHDADAPLVLGSKAGRAPFISPGYSLHDEIAHWRSAGVPAADVFAMATTQAARFLDQKGEFGVVARGARADLLLVDGDPLENLSLLRRPDGVMVAGRWFDAAALRALEVQLRRAAAR